MSDRSDPAERHRSTLSSASTSHDSGVASSDALILITECDRPTAGSTRHWLDRVDEVLIGRGEQRHTERTWRDDRGLLFVHVPDSRISTAHARLLRIGDTFVLEDCGSKNGISVNGRSCTRHVLRDGDLIECGRTFFRYRARQERATNEPLDVDSASLEPALPGLATLSPSLAAHLRAVGEMARANVAVLVLGPTGSGKELVAQSIHALSRRPGRFVSVNCGALPEHLIEAELFGVQRGAFTGATQDRPGLVRASDRGTLFLDEIGDLPLNAQPALLRVLQEREVLPIGSTRPVAVDLRLVAATHHNLDQLVQKQRFRADLLARLRGFTVRLPPLVERLDDLGLLVSELVRRHIPAGDAPPKITVEAMRRLLAYDWPLNIRELDQCLAAALVLSPKRIDVAQLPEPIGRHDKSAPALGEPPDLPLTGEQQARRAELITLLHEFRGSISQVARHMGKDRSQIRRWIRIFGIRREERG